jgi:hypothetical protein
LGLVSLVFSADRFVVTSDRGSCLTSLLFASASPRAGGCDGLNAPQPPFIFYDRTVPVRLNSLMPIEGILLNRLLLLVEDEVAETGDEVETYSPSTYRASLMKVVRFSRRV